MIHLAACLQAPRPFHTAQHSQSAVSGVSASALDSLAAFAPFSAASLESALAEHELQKLHSVQLQSALLLVPLQLSVLLTPLAREETGIRRCCPSQADTVRMHPSTTPAAGSSRALHVKASLRLFTHTQDLQSSVSHQLDAVGSNVPLAACW